MSCVVLGRLLSFLPSFGPFSSFFIILFCAVIDCYLLLLVFMTKHRVHLSVQLSRNIPTCSHEFFCSLSHNLKNQTKWGLKAKQPNSQLFPSQNKSQNWQLFSVCLFSNCTFLIKNFPPFFFGPPSGETSCFSLISEKALIS